MDPIGTWLMDTGSPSSLPPAPSRSSASGNKQRTAVHRMLFLERSTPWRLCMSPSSSTSAHVLQEKKLSKTPLRSLLAGRAACEQLARLHVGELVTAGRLSEQWAQGAAGYEVPRGQTHMAFTG